MKRNDALQSFIENIKIQGLILDNCAQTDVESFKNGILKISELTLDEEYLDFKKPYILESLTEKDLAEALARVLNVLSKDVPSVRTRKYKRDEEDEEEE